MRAILSVVGSGVVLAAMVALPAGLTWADDEKVPQTAEELAKVAAEVGKPGPEHAKLEPLAGSWTYTCKLWMDPSKSPFESKGTVERKWILGGRFLEERVAGTGFDGKPGFEGLGLVGYDNGQKKYISTWACSMGTSTCTGQGNCATSGTGFTFQTQAYCPLAKKIVKGREEVRIESNDKIVAESYRIEDGKEVKAMELVYLRTK